MEMLLIVVSLASLAIATAMSVVAWKLTRDNRVRSAARVDVLESLAFGDDPDALVPALATAATAPAEVISRSMPEPAAPAPVRDVSSASARVRRVARERTAPMRDESLPVAVRFSSFDEPDPAPVAADDSGWDTGISNDTLFIASADTPTTPSRRWLALSTAAMLTAVGGGAVYAFMTPGFLTMTAPAAQTTLATRPLELVSLHYATDEPGYFTVTGIVRNPIGAPQLLNVAAVVYLFDAEGQYVGNGRIALDIKTLEPGLESSFMVRVPTSGAVSRYRVGFRFPDGAVVSHIDRRADSTAGNPAPRQAKRPDTEGS
jgi:hypothetical protein